MKIRRFSIIGLLLLSGCVTAIKSDHITTYKMRTFGVVIGENPTTQTPEIQLGLVSVVWQTIPTSTNQIYSPNYADTYSLEQKGGVIGAFSFGVLENTATGKDSVGSGQNTTDIIAKMAEIHRPIIKTNAPVVPIVSPKNK